MLCASRFGSCLFDWAAMHAALQIPEILERIAEEVSPYGSDRRNMALTCKTFYEPFMDLIWWGLWHIESLIKCLPRHTRHPDKSHELVSVIHIGMGRGVDVYDLSRL